MTQKMAGIVAQQCIVGIDSGEYASVMVIYQQFVVIVQTSVQHCITRALTVDVPSTCITEYYEEYYKLRKFTSL